jgi:hypothetical protein
MMEKPTSGINDKDEEVLRLARKIESLTNPSKDTEDID